MRFTHCPTVRWCLLSHRFPNTMPTISMAIAIPRTPVIALSLSAPASSTSLSSPRGLGIGMATLRSLGHASRYCLRFERITQRQPVPSRRVQRIFPSSSPPRPDDGTDPAAHDGDIFGARIHAGRFVFWIGARFDFTCSLPAAPLLAPSRHVSRLASQRLVSPCISDDACSRFVLSV